MIVVERLSFDDVSKLSDLKSSSTLNIMLVAERCFSPFGAVFRVREELLEEPKNIVFKFSKEDLDDIRSRVNSANGFQLIVKDLERIVGFLDLRILNDDAFIKWFVVDDDYKGEGIEFLLLRRALNYCRFRGVNSVHAEVENVDYDKFDFYRRLGFRVSGLEGVNEREEFSREFKVHMILEL